MDGVLRSHGLPLLFLLGPAAVDLALGPEQVILGLVAAHLIALHEVGSNNPDGIEIKDKLVGAPTVHGNLPQASKSTADDELEKLFLSLA